jgi:DNA repair protein RadC
MDVETGKRLRPRERMLLQGAGALSDAELLGVLIGVGPRGQRAEQVGAELLRLACGNLDELGRMPPEAYATVAGIGAARAVGIAAAMELGRRRAEVRAGLGAPQAWPHVGTAQEVFERFHGRLGDLPHEEFWALLLRRSNHVLAEFQVSRGGTAGTVADPKIIFAKALALRASALIVVHNHPSGNPQPSAADRVLTANLRAAGDFLDLPLLDHVIVARERYFSFSDTGSW